MAMNNHGGKGSAARPLGVSREQFGNNFDAIFGKKNKETKPQTEGIVKVTLPFSGMTVELKKPELEKESGEEKDKDQE